MTRPDVLALLMRLPPTHYLELGVELDADDGRPTFGAILFERCPDGARVRDSISADLGDTEAAAQLVAGMLGRYAAR